MTTLTAPRLVAALVAVFFLTLSACDSAPGPQVCEQTWSWSSDLPPEIEVPLNGSYSPPTRDAICYLCDDESQRFAVAATGAVDTSQPGRYPVEIVPPSSTGLPILETTVVVTGTPNPQCNSTLTINSSVDVDNPLRVHVEVESTGLSRVEINDGNGWTTSRVFDFSSFGTKTFQVRGISDTPGCSNIERSFSVTLTDPGDGGGTGDNEAPILNSGEVSVEVGSSTTLDLLSILSAIDPDGDDIDVLRIEQPPAGSFSSLNQEAGTVVYNAPSSPRSRFTVQVTATDGELEGVGNLFIEVVEVPPSCTVDVRQRTIDIGTTRSDQPVDFNYLATTVPVNCTGGELDIRNTRVDPSSINLSALPSQGKGWYRMTNFAGVSNGTVVQATAEAYYTNGNVSGGEITVETEVQIATSGRTSNAWCGTRATSNGVLAVRACWADGDYGDLTVEIQRSR